MADLLASLNVPAVGTVTTRRGYTFRVDHVAGGEVYVVRWPAGVDCQGWPMRVSLEVWNQETAEAALSRKD